MTGLAHVANDPANLQSVIEIIDRDGGVIVDDYISAEVLDSIKSDLLPMIAKQKTGADDFFGKRTRRMSRLFARTRHCAGIILNPLFLESARHFICKPRLAWAGDQQYEINCQVNIGVSQLIQIGPGEGAQPLHRDDAAFQWSRAYGKEARLQIMVAISDFTAENGGTLVIPGSHKWDDNRPPLREEAISTEMKAGSALLFLGGTYHAGGQNVTENELRTGLTLTLDAANVRQEENPYLSLDPELVASYPEEIQRLLGWSMFGSSLGWVEIDGIQSDPHVLLKQTA
jgi:ectoine hydroxylase-related dioxygenase (phytanoyl-CoA dioxygenase family)